MELERRNSFVITIDYYITFAIYAVKFARFMIVECYIKMRRRHPVSEKRDKFKRLAESRVNRAISDIRSIGKLSNKSHYEYTEDDVKKIYTALRGELDNMRDAFSQSVRPPKPFRL
ncbi:hypothetical protein KUV47_00395 [Vannielia litorea]|uniref:hypothetical protein n=1 Tax=Vannielia litorea TaxID=1217970 RepID=UPI001C9510A8|nr:hypothetical protein [Vannielia litorea]MBY6151656.1 hypothetical protein [Vannielia litorea]